MIRRLALRAADRLGALPILVRAAVFVAVRRAAWTAGLRLVNGPPNTITLASGPESGGVRRAVRVAARHAAYAMDVASHFDYYHGAVEPVAAEGFALVDYSRPAVHRLRPSGDAFRFSGFAEPEETTGVYLRHAQLAPGDLVIDAGAYCGASTVAFARAVGPTGRVLALEPDPVNAAALRENLAWHGAANVEVLEMGVWRETGDLAFVAEGNMGSALATFLGRASATRTVRVVSLNDAVAQAVAGRARDRVAFIKLDIEGAEVEVLQAATDVLRTHGPRLAIEPHRVEDGQLNTDGVTAALLAAGYDSVLADQGVGAHPLVLAAPRR